jgi:hypothetical protein
VVDDLQDFHKISWIPAIQAVELTDVKEAIAAEIIIPEIFYAVTIVPAIEENVAGRFTILV